MGGLGPEARSTVPKERYEALEASYVSEEPAVYYYALTFCTT